LIYFLLSRAAVARSASSRRSLRNSAGSRPRISSSIRTTSTVSRTLVVLARRGARVVFAFTVVLSSIADVATLDLFGRRRLAGWSDLPFNLWFSLVCFNYARSQRKVCCSSPPHNAADQGERHYSERIRLSRLAFRVSTTDTLGAQTIFRR
jgi:hypothetical protein